MDGPARTFGQWWDSTEPRVGVSIVELTAIAQRAFESVGATADDAAFLTETYLDKAIQGDHARGVGRIPSLVASARAGTLDLRPTIEVVRETSATAVVDGGPRASGRLVCRAGMNMAIEKARHCGIGMVGARGSAGGLTPFVRMAIDAGMIGMAMVQSVPTVAPFGGYEPLLGNAPVAWGVPSSTLEPVIVDMSFTQSSASPIVMAAEQGQSVAPGLVLDEYGNPTTNAADFPNWELTHAPGSEGLSAKGTLVPLGDSHKGFAMVFVVGLLCSILTDTSPPWELYRDVPQPGRYGTVLAAIDPSAFDPSGAVGARVDAFCDRVTSAPRKPGVEEILYPGLRSQQLRAARRAEGWFEIPRSHYDLFVRLATDIGDEGAAGLTIRP